MKDLPELYSMTNDPQENFNVASLPQNAEVTMHDSHVGGHEKKSLVLFSGGGRAGNETAPGMESRDIGH